jgi:hypothetical protein
MLNVSGFWHALRFIELFNAMRQPSEPFKPSVVEVLPFVLNQRLANVVR